MVSRVKEILERKLIDQILTGYVTTRGELGRHRGVHGDHDLFFVGHECISILDLLMDPGLEVLPQDGCADVHDPLLGHLA